MVALAFAGCGDNPALAKAPVSDPSGSLGTIVFARLCDAEAGATQSVPGYELTTFDATFAAIAGAP